jgi:hypothetical protein
MGEKSGKIHIRRVNKRKFDAGSGAYPVDPE